MSDGYAGVDHLAKETKPVVNSSIPQQGQAQGGESKTGRGGGFGGGTRSNGSFGSGGRSGAFTGGAATGNSIESPEWAQGISDRYKPTQNTPKSPVAQWQDEKDDFLLGFDEGYEDSASQESEQKEQPKSDALWDEYFKVAMLPDSPAAPFMYHFGNTQTRAGGVMAGAIKDYAGNMLSTAGALGQSALQNNVIHRTAENVEALMDATGFESKFIEGLLADEQRINDRGMEFMQDVRDTGATLSAEGQGLVQAQKEGLGGLGQVAVDLGSAGTQLGMDIGLGWLTGYGMMLPAAIRSFGSSAEQAAADGADLDQQLLYGTAAGAVTYGMGHLGNIAASGLKIAAPGISDKAVTAMVDKLANKLASTPEGITALKNIGLMAASGLGEWAEGFLESAVEPYLRRLTYDKDAETILQNSELLHDAAYDGMIESILGVFGEGINLTVNSDVTANSDTSLQDSYKNPVQNSEGHGILGTEGDVARRPQQEFSPKELAEIGEALLSSGIMPDQKYLDAMGLDAATARGMTALYQMENIDDATNTQLIVNQQFGENSMSGIYTDKIKWGIHDIDVRPDGKGFWGERLKQSDTRVDSYELKINPQNESYYLPHPEGGYVQFENMVNATVQDGKLILQQKSFYHVNDMPEFAKKKVLEEAGRQLAAAQAADYTVEWLVSDEVAVEQLERFFKEQNVDIVVTYYPE